MIRTHKKTFSPQIQSTIGAIFSALLLLFAISHLAAFAATGITSVLLFSLAETVIAVLFLLRMPFLGEREEPEGFDSEDVREVVSATSAADIHSTYSRC